MTLYGKEKSLEVLEKLFVSGRMPHGIIYTGENGAGKSVLAEYTAKLLLCENANDASNKVKNICPCGICKSCRKAESKSHPDIIYVKELADNGKYKTDFLRKIINESIRRPNDGDLKIYIFKDCDTMSPVCQNTLLKFIEEPLPFNRFIFTASSTGEVLETVLSRLTGIEVNFPTEEQRIKILEDNKENTEKGKPEKDTVEFEEIARKITDGILSRDEYKTAAAFSNIRERDVLYTVLDLFSGILRDSTVYKCGGGEYYGCYNSGAEKVADAFSLEAIIKTQKKIFEYIAKSEQNPNLTLACAAYSSGIFSSLAKNNL